MIENSISLCMITKNEEKNIEKCLENIYKIVDEIIIVDTGSEDNTIEMSRKFGAIVISHKWNDDFSDARNIALKNATKDWILVLDADEVITPDEMVRLKNILQINPNLEGFHLRLSNMISGVSVGDAIVLRVFKNRKEYKFEGKIHEQVILSIEALNGKHCIGATDIKIQHYGYDPQIANIEQKQKRNIDLLNQCPIEKRDGYFYYSLGNEYARINENYKALKNYYKALQIPINKGQKPVYLSYLYLHISKVLNSCEKYREAIVKLDDCEKICSDFKDLYFMKCVAYIECNKITKARMALKKYLRCESMSYEYPCSDFEKHYNMDELLKKLKLLSIDSKDNLISVLIMCKEQNKKIAETIKNINELSDNVVVVAYDNLDIQTDTIDNLFANIIEVKEYIPEEEMFMIGSKMCTGKFILLLKPEETCNLENQRLLVNILSNTESDNFSLNIINSKANLSTEELRIYKNNIEADLNENFFLYINHIHSREVKYLDININKI